MKYFRAIVCLMLIAALVLSLGGCGVKDETPSVPTDPPASHPTESRTPTEAGTEAMPTISTTPAETLPESLPTETTEPEDEEGNINRTFCGTWISEDGIPDESVYFSLCGTIRLDDAQDTLMLDIRFPDSFRYRYNPQKEYSSQSRQVFNLPYLVCPHYVLDTAAVNFQGGYLVLCPEKEYVLFSWDNIPGRYLVASRDPNVDPREILSYFHSFITHYLRK